MSKNVEILIVEENPEESENLKRILELHNYNASIEHNGKLVTDKIRRRKPEILICAVKMLETDGYELCRAIKEDDEL